MAHVDTNLSVIFSANGYQAPYRLVTERKWNVGLRRHVASLNGRIDVSFSDKSNGSLERGSYRVFDTFDEAKRAVDLYFYGCTF